MFGCIELLELLIVICMCIVRESAMRHTSCIINHPLTSVEPETLPMRMLQSSTPHGLNMKGDYTGLNSWSDKTMIQIIKRLFVIANAYYRSTIKVYGLTRSQSIYISSNSCSYVGNIMPLQYSTGFDVEVFDMVIFLQIESDPSSTYVAAAAPCILRRWPIYGFIVFNSQYIDNDITHTGTFHQNIQVLVK